jgi:predicted phosphate transport protein (TIGR00153 family)
MESLLTVFCKRNEEFYNLQEFGKNINIFLKRLCIFQMYDVPLSQIRKREFFMKINNILSIFTPKDTKFIPLLQETAAILVEAGSLLEQFFKVSGKQQKEICEQIKVQETKADKTTGRIFKALNEIFITPFDREDIHELADNLDDVIDSINRSARKVIMYSPSELPKYTRKMAEIIQRGTVELANAIEGLSSLRQNDKKIRKSCKEIKNLEELADAVYEEGIIDLFHGNFKSIELFKLKEVLQEMEKAANKINHTSKVLKTIIVKYA